MRHRLKPIKVILLNEAEDFFDQLDEKIKIKFLKSFDKTKFGYRGSWFEPLKQSNGIFEFRQMDHRFFYRILAFWDKTDNDETLILASHGFNKKTNKTPPEEIRKAEKIKKDYFINKQKNIR